MSFSEKIVNDNAEGYLRHYIMDIMSASSGDNTPERTGKTDIRKSPEFAIVCSSYAMLQSQKTSQKQQDELTKQNIELAKQNTNLQRWLVLFSAIAVVVPIVVGIIARI